MYKGYYYDVETGLYYLNSRYYDPEVGRFISADDISYLDPESINRLNLYSYCGNNPIMRVDPSGHTWYDWVIGGAIILGCLAMTVITVGGIAAAGGAMLSVVTSTMAVNGAAAFWAGAFVGSAILGAAGIGVGGLIGQANGVGFWEGASQGFMIGAIAGAVIGGTWGYTHFALQESGKMAIKAHSSTLSKISSHVSQFDYAPNDAMLNRLGDAYKSGSRLTGADRNFFIHELREATFMAKGLGAEQAHLATLAYHQMSGFAVYHPAVIQAFGSLYFNSGWFAYWGLTH